jgi:hypothetical protein
MTVVAITGFVVEYPDTVVPLIKYLPATAVSGVGYAVVARVSVQYVYTRPPVDPSKIAESLRLTVPGKHAAGGSVIIRVGGPGVDILTSADGTEVHSEAFLTVKV